MGWLRGLLLAPGEQRCKAAEGVPHKQVGMEGLH